MASGPRPAYATTLDDGTFTMTWLPSGEYEVRARGPGARPAGQKDDPVAKVTVAAPDRAKVRLTVAARGGVIEGRVVDGTGAPVTDAFVDAMLGVEGAAMPRYDMGKTPVLTDNAGHFTLEGLADGEYGLRAYRKGGAEATADHVKAGMRDVVIKLDAGASIAGAVTLRGAPVERFTLAVHKKGSTFYRTESFFHAGGQFELRDLPAGTYEVTASTPLGRADVETALADREQKTGLALSFALRAAVDGRVVALEGGAAIFARIDLQRDAWSTAGNSGADGSFHIEGLTPGKWTLTVSPWDASLEPLSMPIVVLDDGSATDVGTVRLPGHRP
jgi:hypothetical protein